MSAKEILLADLDSFNGSISDEARELMEEAAQDLGLHKNVRLALKIISVISELKEARIGCHVEDLKLSSQVLRGVVDQSIQNHHFERARGAAIALGLVDSILNNNKKMLAETQESGKKIRAFHTDAVWSGLG